MNSLRLGEGSRRKQDHEPHKRETLFATEALGRDAKEKSREAVNKCHEQRNDAEWVPCESLGAF
jgi:hypothetical protein